MDAERSEVIAYDPNANWTARTNAGGKSPIYAVQFDDISATTLYTTGRVRNQTSTVKPYLVTPGSIAQKLSQLKGRASLSLFNFALVDKDDEITALVLGNNMINQRVSLLSGYADLDESDYAPYPVGQVQDVVLSKDSRSWVFKIADLKRHQLDQIMRNAGTKITKPFARTFLLNATVGENFFKVQTNGLDLKFEDSIMLGPSTAPGFVGDEEVAVVSKTVDEGSKVTRIVLQDALVNDYLAGDQVRRATVLLVGNPVNMIYAILTGDFSSGSFPLTKAEGLPTGLGIAASDIDTAALIAERDDFYGDEEWEFEITKPLAGFRFLEQKIYRFLGYPITTADGKISFRMYAPPRPTDAIAGLTQITENQILSWRWRQDNALHLNRVKLGLDANAIAGTRIDDFVEIEDTADQAATKETRELVDLDTGFVRTLRGVRIAEERIRILLRRFLTAPEQLEIDATLTARAIELGEVVEVTHAEIPDRVIGARGLAKKRMEVVERKEELDKEKLSLVLQHAGFTRPAFIAPDSAPLYGAASDADKEYSYIAPDAGNFPDGKPPYESI